MILSPAIEPLQSCRPIRPIPPGRAALFLDRDGVIIRDTGYVAQVAQVDLLPGAAEAIRTMNGASWPVVVVSNQSGLGRGYFDHAALEVVQACVEARLAAQGAWLDAVLICGAAPWDSTTALSWRKPKPGMFLAARDRFALDLANSIMVGDRVTDMVAARDAGVARRILLAEPGDALPEAATDVARDLISAIRGIAGPGLASVLG